MRQRFKCGESRAEGFRVAPLVAAHTISHDSSELVTLQEAISATGKIGVPLLFIRDFILWKPGFQPKKRMKCLYQPPRQHLLVAISSMNGFTITFPLPPTTSSQLS